MLNNSNRPFFASFLVSKEAETALGIQHGIGALRYPLAKEDDGRQARGITVAHAGDVEVSIDEGFDLGVAGVVLTREVNQAVGSGLGDDLLLLGIAVGAVLIGPA